MSSNTQSRKILILAANPSGLRLDQEIREIEDAIRRGIRREQFQIITRQAVRPKDIRRAIAEERPQIVHFCGHGTSDGSLVLEDDGGQSKLVQPKGLAALFELHSAYVNCVLVNACYSEQCAEVISQYINYVIGMNQAVNDRTAIKFSEGFYDAIGYGVQDNQEEFRRAFQEGIVAIMLENLPGSSIPVLKKKAAAHNNESHSEKIGINNTEQKSIATSLKYFYYISRSKLSMLAPQFNLPSDDAVTDMLNLTKTLYMHNLIEDDLHGKPLETSNFYHYSGTVNQGLFSISTYTHEFTTYLIWALAGESLYLMFGSPRNILGDEFGWEGVHIPTTGRTHLELSNFLDKIVETNDSWSEELYEYPPFPEKNAFPNPQRRRFREEDDTRFRRKNELWVGNYSSLENVHGLMRENKKAASVGLLCFRLLKNLPNNDIDMIFKIFSHYELSNQDSQILKEIYRSEFNSNRDNTKEYQTNISNWSLKNIYIGSPLYVALT